MSKRMGWLDAMLPPMQCDKDCGLCCGVVACTQSEFDRVKAYIAEKGITPVKQGTQCPFYQGGTCAIYEVRPFPCRLFGHTAKMQCPRGYNIDIAPSAENAIIKRIRGAHGTLKDFRLLHELAMTADEAHNAIIEELTSSGEEAAGRHRVPTPLTIAGRSLEERGGMAKDAVKTLAAMPRHLRPEGFNPQGLDY